MAAALRNTARTLVTLQRTPAAASPAAIEVVRGCQQLSQILVRRGGPSAAISSTRRFAYSTGAHDVNAYDGMVNEKKKELYSLLGEMHRSKTYMLLRSNKEVLYHLSKQVDEDEWRWHRRSYLLRCFVFYGLAFINGYNLRRFMEKKDHLGSSTSTR